MLLAVKRAGLAFAVGAIVAFAAPARALVVEYMTVARIRFDPDGYVYFSTTTQPAETCSNWGEYFRFESTTPVGKQWVAALLASKLSGAPVSIWAYPSSAPGTTESTGCTAAAMSTVWLFGLSK